MSGLCDRVSVYCAYKKPIKQSGQPHLSNIGPRCFLLEVVNTKAQLLDNSVRRNLLPVKLVLYRSNLEKIQGGEFVVLERWSGGWW